MAVAVVTCININVSIHFQWCVGKCTARAVFIKSGADPMSHKKEQEKNRHFMFFSLFFEIPFLFFLIYSKLYSRFKL